MLLAVAANTVENAEVEVGAPSERPVVAPQQAHRRGLARRRHALLPTYTQFAMSLMPAWLQSALRLPIAFAQVREDSDIDEMVCRAAQSQTGRVGDGVRMIMVASGGCTAAALVASGKLSRLVLVDPNPAQIALVRLKLRLLDRADRADRLAILGHTPLTITQRARRLEAELSELDLTENALGPPEVVAEFGPDHVGRYERAFVALRATLGAHADQLDAVLDLADPTAQTRAVAPEAPLGKAIDAALDEVLSLENLVALFGDEATQNRVLPFARHFAARLRHVLATQPARENPYLHQMWRGRFPLSTVYTWLAAAPPPVWPDLDFRCVRMDAALAGERGDWDVVHLSNILDWLTPGAARTTLDLAAQALHSGGWVIIRQLNSTLDISRLTEAFDWDERFAAELHAADRSFFYRRFYVGRRR